MMNTVTFEATISQPAVGALPAKATYLPAADLVEVLFEQVQYLVSHGRECSAGCADCVRLVRMKSCLLRPFGEDALAQQ